MDAFDTEKRAGDQLLIVGGGPEEERLKAYRGGLKHKEVVVFTGRIPREEVLKKMGESQVFTLISDRETYGMVYAEAMLQGCLVIASRGGGFDGIIEDGVNGFICSPGDSEELKAIYQRIRKLSIEERSLIGQRAIKTVEHMSEREVADNYLNDVLSTQGQY